MVTFHAATKRYDHHQKEFSEVFGHGHVTKLQALDWCTNTMVRLMHNVLKQSDRRLRPYSHPNPHSFHEQCDDTVSTFVAGCLDQYKTIIHDTFCTHGNHRQATLPTFGP